MKLLNQIISKYQVYLFGGSIILFIKITFPKLYEHINKWLTTPIEVTPFNILCWMIIFNVFYKWEDKR